MAGLRLGRLVVIGLAGLGLSACGGGGAVAQARLACVDVHKAIALYDESLRPNRDAAERDALAARAMATLMAATPAAAQATSADGTWNPLMTTINEAERVPLGNLVASLTRLCQVADSSQPYF